MKKLLSLSAALLLGMSASAFATDLSGTYDCKGHAPSEKEYTDGVLTISKSGDLYNFSWQFAKENSNTLGKGVFNKEDDQTIAVLFTIEKPKKEMGVIIYRPTSNGIKGTAIIEGRNSLGGETCVKKS